MGITIDWDNQEQTVIKGVVVNPWTWDELFAAWDAAVAMINSVPHSVHMIVVAESSGFPPGNVLTQLNRLSFNMPENTGLAIMVTTNRFLAVINSTLFKLSPRMSKRGRVVASLEEAYALIAAEPRAESTQAQ